MWQRIVDRENAWGWDRSVPYRVLGAVFLAFGLAVVALCIRVEAIWWVYGLSLGFLLPGLVCVSFKEGVIVDAETKTITQWWQTLGLRHSRQEAFTRFGGCYVSAKPTHSGSVSSVAHEVWLQGDDVSMKVFVADSEDRAFAVQERIGDLTGLPKTQPPEKDMAKKMVVVIIFFLVVFPALAAGIFWLLKLSS